VFFTGDTIPRLRRLQASRSRACPPQFEERFEGLSADGDISCWRLAGLRRVSALAMYDSISPACMRLTVVPASSGAGGNIARFASGLRRWIQRIHVFRGVVQSRRLRCFLGHPRSRCSSQISLQRVGLEVACSIYSSSNPRSVTEIRRPFSFRDLGTSCVHARLVS
jgi:hypothetical protein